MILFSWENLQTVKVEKRLLSKMQKDPKEFEKTFGVDISDEGRVTILQGLFELNAEKLEFFKRG